MPLHVWLCSAALASIAARADAADARLRVSIQPKGYADALIDLGIQANVSIVGTSACGPGGRVSLSGRYALDEALGRLLAGAPCEYRIVDPRTVRIIPAPSTPAPPAPPEPPPAPTLVTELVVTATKRPASLERLPAAVTAISREQIGTTGAVDVSLTTGQVAGVQTTNLGPGRDKLLIRGLSDGAFTGRTRSTVSTYMDDIPLNQNAPDPDLRLADVERIEVVRGPQGALYGSGAIAGIYRIVTRKPDLEQLDAGLLAGAATTKGGDTSNEFEAFLNVPIAPGRAALRLAGYKDRQGGFIDDVRQRTTNVDDTRRDGARLSARIQFDPAWRLDVMAATQHLRSNDSQYVVTMSNRMQRANEVQETHNNDVTFGSVNLEGTLGAASLSASTAYVHHVFSSQYEVNAHALAAGGALSQFGGPGRNLGAYLENSRVDIVAQDIVLRSSRPGRLSWLVGAYGASIFERTPSRLGVFTGSRLGIVYQENRKDRRTDLALYGEATYDLGGGWSVSAGGRQYQNKVRTNGAVVIDATFNMFGDTRAFTRKRLFKGFLPKLSVQHETAGGDLYYALYSEGYRPGGFNSAGLQTVSGPRSSFQPDRLRNYEVGAKLKGLDGRFTLRAAAYYDEWSNIQTDQYRPSGLAYVANVANARIAGVEAEASYEWDFGLNVQVNGLYADSNLSNPNADFVRNGGRVTEALPGVPKSSLGVLAIYQRSLTDRLSLRLVGEASYLGESGLSFNSVVTSRTSHYARVRIAAELATETWRGSIYVSNPFNDANDTFSYGNPFSFGLVQQSTPQRPRTVGVRLSAGF